MNPHGILRNKTEAPATPSDGELDRQQVIRNTRYNAQLALQSKGDEIRAQIRSKDLDHLQWDEVNLYKTEQEKAATMKIDEPKTPYEGGFNPEGEYYQDDDPRDVPAFSLGEGQYEETGTQLLHGGEVIANDSESGHDSESEHEAPLLAEERHKRFEAMRKSHYHLAANPLKHKQDLDVE